MLLFGLRFLILVRSSRNSVGGFMMPNRTGSPINGEQASLVTVACWQFGQGSVVGFILSSIGRRISKV